MAKRRTILAVLAASFALADAAVAQNTAPLTSRDVVGDWTLAITAADRPGFSVTVEAKDGGRPDLPLTITARTGGRLGCILRGDPAECRIDKGKLVVVMPTRSGGARMTFRLAERTRAGFSGTASVRARLLPFGGTFGTVLMTRRG